MLFGLLIFFYTFVSLLLIFVILLQKGSNSMGFGNMGGGNQMLFGGSGGQNIFQKITWVLAFLFMAGSLVLAIAKTKQVRSSRYLEYATQAPQIPMQAPVSPAQAPSTPPAQ
jgi:protein translocase SecG subunit